MKVMKLIKDFQQTSGIEPNLFISVEDKLTAKISNTIYRILQECLTNILRHSQATEVFINIISQNEILYFSIEDNGKGFNPQSKNQGHGLLGIQDRVNNVNGQFSLITEPNNGCQINININI
jgi:signal transduction histidine kinase